MVSTLLPGPESVPFSSMPSHAAGDLATRSSRIEGECNSISTCRTHQRCGDVHCHLRPASAPPHNDVAAKIFPALAVWPQSPKALGNSRVASNQGSYVLRRTVRARARGRFVPLRLGTKTQCSFTNGSGSGLSLAHFHACEFPKS